MIVCYVFFQYLSLIDGNTKVGRGLVLKDNSFLQSSVQKYKHDITNFLTLKMKIWYNTVVKTIYNFVMTIITK